MLDVVLIAAAAVLVAALSTRRYNRRGESRLVDSAELPFIVSLQVRRGESRLRDSAARRALEKAPEKAPDKARYAH